MLFDLSVIIYVYYPILFQMPHTHASFMDICTTLKIEYNKTVTSNWRKYTAIWRKHWSLYWGVSTVNIALGCQDEKHWKVK